MAGSIEGGGPENINGREGNPPPLTKEQIKGHVSALKSLIKSHNRKNKGDPIRSRLQHCQRKRGGEWPMPVWCRMFQQTLDGSARGWFECLPHDSINEWAELREAFAARYSVRRACFKERHGITKIIRKANESLTAFKERWTVETGFIMGVPEVMKISSFMDSVKSPELAKRFSDKVPTTANEMMERLDDFVRSEAAYAKTELPKGETGGRDAYRANRARDDRAPYLPPRGEYNRRVALILTLDSLTKHLKEILATETQLHLPVPHPMLNPLRSGNTDRYCDYHQEKGYYINDCIQLRKQLEMALESEKLNHLAKAVRQRGRGSYGREEPQPAKIINVINVNSVKDKKRKVRDATESWMNIPISFLAISFEDISEEPLIVEVEVEGYLVRRVYVDEGYSVEVMFKHCFENLNPKIKARLKETQTDLIGFAGEISKPLGKIELEVCFGNGGLCRWTSMRFIVVRAPSPYNIILGRPGLKTLRAIPSTIHSMMNFPTPKGIATLVTRTVIIAECRRLEKKQLVEEESPGEKGEVAITEEVLVNLSYPYQLVIIEGGLSGACKEQLKCLLKDNMNVFAWEPFDMAGVPRRIIEHALNVNPSLDPMCQKRRTFSMEKSRVVTKEVAEWVKAGIVHPMKYPTYISNPVLVKKGDGTWRMCIDFKNLNSACPKDYYPPPNIDCKVESVMGFKYKCFLDAYKGYHQIQMAEKDKEKTAFYTDQGTYCYTKMPFGLKNAGATYQRLVDSTFQSQIGRNLEAYVDDMVIKSKDEKILLADIAETFDNLKKINMKLNPKKCSFGVEEGKFLGANPRKTKALVDLRSPQTLKEMQSLSGKLAALNRFLAKSAERSLPFFNTLKNITKENKHEYRWTQEAKEAFQQMKKLIMDLPSLTPPQEKETLYAYLAVSTEAVSAVLLTDRKGRQSPVQYVSRTLNEAERNYAPIEKLALSLIHMTRRLRRYFEAHPIKVITDQPIKNILSNTETSGASPRGFSLRSPRRREGRILLPNAEGIPEKDDTETWTLFMDGASSPKGSGAGLVLIGPSGIEYTYALRLTFPSTNNEAEYEALLAGLRIARQMNISNIEVKVDSKLVASQINGSYEASKDSMIRYLAKAKEYSSRFKSFSIENIPRNMNQKADMLSKLASVAFNHLTKEVLVEVLNERSTEGQEVHSIVEEEGDNGTTPIKRCLEEGVWPKDKNKARCLQAKIGQYAMESGVLFKKGYLVPMLRCVGPLQANYVIREIHMGSCGMDILGPLPPARGGAKFVIVTIEYFTKWIEAKPLVKITGKELVNDPFRSWYGRFEIHQMNMAVAHPQANGLVERANRSLMEGIKTRLGREKAGEAVIPAEIGIPTYRTLMIIGEYNEEEMRLHLDLLQERRETSVVREARYKTKMEQYYNKKVRSAGFRTGEFVFRRNKASRVEYQGKLGLKWEGPYKVMEAYENGSYKLQTLEDKEVPRT
ncbi:reverse transcriptase domain-containing protein [Tanacetum coccineum]